MLQIRGTKTQQTEHVLVQLSIFVDRTHFLGMKSFSGSLVLTQLFSIDKIQTNIFYIPWVFDDICMDP